MAEAAPLAELTFKHLWAWWAGTVAVNVTSLGRARWPKQRRPPSPYIYILRSCTAPGSYVEAPTRMSGVILTRRGRVLCVEVSPFGQYP